MAELEGVGALMGDPALKVWPNLCYSAQSCNLMRSGLDAVHNSAQVLVLLALLAADICEQASTTCTLVVQDCSINSSHVSVAKS